MLEQTPVFRLSVDDHLMIAHSLPGEFFGSAQQLHGATLAITVTFERRGLDEHGVVMDIGAAHQLLGAVLDPLRHQNLDEHPDFAQKISTTEVICQHIGLQLAGSLPQGHGLQALEVAADENPQARASVRLDLQ